MGIEWFRALARRLKIRHKLTVALALMLVAGFFAAFFIQKTDYRFATYPHFKKIERGMTREQVVALLGVPDQVHVMSDRYDISYKLKGYTFRAFKEAGTVMVYQRNEEVCYVLIKGERVADVAIGYK